MTQYDDPQGEATDESEPSFRLDQEIARRYDPSRLSQLIVRDAGRGESLDLHTRAQMERRLGGSFGGVRIFRGPLAEEVTSRYRADAVTVGGTEMILVREGWQSNFQSAEGHALLAHELTHVRQQQRGLHFAHSHGYGDDSPLEREAYAVQHAVAAEQRGDDLMAKHEKLRRQKEVKFWEAVRKRGREKYEEHKQQGDMRGSPNSQGNHGSNGQYG
ncbi:MAG: DUF4157 domain-containing protein [Polyangia bacterium]